MLLVEVDLIVARLLRLLATPLEMGDYNKNSKEMV